MVETSSDVGLQSDSFRKKPLDRFHMQIRGPGGPTGVKNEENTTISSNTYIDKQERPTGRSAGVTGGLDQLRRDTKSN